MPRFALFSLFALICMSACSKAKPSHTALTKAPYVDISRLSGSWHVPARIPTMLDKTAVDMRIDITTTQDRSMDLVWTFKKSEDSAADTTWNLSARIEDPANTTSWIVSYIWPIKMRYEVIEYSGDYSWMVIASRDRRYMWVLSRNKDLPPELLDGLFNRLKSSEFDISAIIKQAKKS